MRKDLEAFFGIIGKLYFFCVISIYFRVLVFMVLRKWLSRLKVISYLEVVYF